jgi:hypothetical protein
MRMSIAGFEQGLSRQVHMANAIIWVEHQYSGSEAIKDTGIEAVGIQYCLIPVVSMYCVHAKSLK